MDRFLNNTFSLLCFTALGVTIIFTPWLNVDSLIIPKLIILFSMSLFILPRVVFTWKNLFVNKIPKTLAVLSILIFIQLLLVIFNSDAPLEQQFFGRTGRALGFATELSLLIITIASCCYITYKKVKLLLLTFLVSVMFSSLYSIIQYFGIDIFDWNTRTNGIIGTLGNPNFQSSLAAMAIVPALVYFWGQKKGLILSILLVAPLLVVLYISQSTQGYITSSFSILLLLLFYYWYKNRVIFSGLFISSAILVALAIIGMLNKGPFADLLYKYSIKSRGEIFRAAINTAQDNPFFGVGLDSLSDYYWIYRDPKDVDGVGEYADHAHNAFLNNASTGGFTLAFLQLSISILGVYSFIVIQKHIKSFDKFIVAIFCAWSCYQLQSLISPANISMLTWNAVITGSLIGLTSLRASNAPTIKTNPISIKMLSVFLFIISLIVVYPYFNVDRLQLKAARTGDANLAIKSAISYPESTVRYTRISEEFLGSNLIPEVLYLSREAVKFNPNSFASWGYILISPIAPYEERVKAKIEVLKLDPLNKSVKNYIIPSKVN